MKQYKVIFGFEALSEAQAAAAYIAAAPLNAARWYAKLERAIGGLATFPNRCPKAPESKTLTQIFATSFSAATASSFSSMATLCIFSTFATPPVDHLLPIPTIGNSWRKSHNPAPPLPIAGNK
jgi:hypothetical protein